MSGSTTFQNLSRPVLVGRLLVIVAVLVVAHMGGQMFRLWTGHDYVYGLIPLFDLNLESNLPSYFSSLLFLCAAVVAFAVAGTERAAGSRLQRHWTLLALGLAFLGVDEAVGLHELTSIAAREWLGDSQGRLAWYAAAAVLLVAVATYFAPFLRSLPAPVLRSFLLAAGLFLMGAIAVDAANEAYFGRFGSDLILTVFLFAIEEGLEMVGVVWLIAALLRYAERRHGHLAIGFQHPRSRVDSRPEPSTVSDLAGHL